MGKCHFGVFKKVLLLIPILEIIQCLNLPPFVLYKIYLFQHQLYISYVGVHYVVLLNYFE